MKVHRVTLDECCAANGLVVVIDVLRAFTPAAYAFKGEDVGKSDIWGIFKRRRAQKKSSLQNSFSTTEHDFSSFATAPGG